MTVTDYAQLGATVAQVLTLAWAMWQFRHELQNQAAERREADDRRSASLQEATALRHKNEDDALNARKIEIYQRLEIESNRVFEFEARHPQLVPMMKRHLAPKPSLGEIIVQDEYGKQMSDGQIAMIARKYYEMNCNLFEIAARLREKDLIDHDVFGSWVAWYFDTVTEWGFRGLWADLRDNYTADLRSIFDPLCIALISDWDIPHAEGQLPLIETNGLPDISGDELERRRRDFYVQVAQRYDCKTIGGWLDQVDASRLPKAHPPAYC